MSCLPSAIFLTPSSNSLLHQPGSSHSQPGISQAQPSFMHLHPSCAHNMLHLTLYRALHILICFVYSQSYALPTPKQVLYTVASPHILYCSVHTQWALPIHAWSWQRIGPSLPYLMLGAGEGENLGMRSTCFEGGKRIAVGQKWVGHQLSRVVLKKRHCRLSKVWRIRDNLKDAGCSVCPI